MVMSRAEATAWVGRLRSRSRDRTIVLTNGVFDLLHPGHVRYLTEARNQGDVLIVGVNGDRSARALGKAPDRPVTNAAERAEVLAAISVVDAVVIFDEDTPLALVSELQPDVLVKGADWAPNAIVGRDVVEARGGRVVRISLAAGYSTTAILDKVRAVGQ
jgi:D-beta-D-heptose 7-phosphate kinase/D-beta-D-heptose 1-phosphate adenosyltransferase